MADTYRIEIPVEVVNATNTGNLEKLETILQKIFSALQKNTSAAKNMSDAVAGSADRAGSAMEQAAESAEDAAHGYEKAGDAAQKSGQEQTSAAENAEQATDKLADSVEDTAQAFQETGNAAKQAGTKSGSAFSNASGNVDKFTQRIEKSNTSLRKMFAQKLQLFLAAVDKVTPVLNSVKSSVKSLVSKAWNVTVKMYDMVTAPFRKLKSMIMSPIMMTLSLAGVGLGAGSFVNTFTDFVSGMSNVKALSGATAEEFTLLTNKAEELGATTKFTASEAAEGMQYLAMAGWKTNDIIAAMPGLLNLAAAGGTSLGTAADIVSDVMTAMGMSADQASRAADIFARTATGTNTTIENLGETLKYAAPIAHSFGLELSEVSTITGMMANAGIKGSQAGTAIRSSLLEMASPAKAAQEVMKKLELTFSDSTGKMKSMNEIVRQLSEKFKGLSEQEKLAYANDLFGTYASSAWLGVIEQGADEFDRLYKSIDQSNGAAKDMANTQLDNLAGDMTLLQSAVDGMKISIMKELDPYLRKGVQWLTGKIPDITAKVESLIKTGIEKGKRLKDFLKDVFSSADYQNANGFAEKFFVAWDKIIAEPFSNWWEGNGRQTVLGAVEKVGSGLGEMYHGIITGIFAAIKGEEIDFDGLNLTGLGKAGAEAARTFISSFKDSLDLGGLFNDAPGILKAGLLGFGAFKIGSGALGAVKTIAQIKTAFYGVSAAAGTAATSTAGFSSILAAIPGWGWVAAAAIAAVTVGVIAYNKYQEEQEKRLLATGQAAAKMAEEYTASTKRIGAAMDAVDNIKEIELRIKENKEGNAEVIQSFQEELKGILDRTVTLEAQLADTTLTEDQVKEYQSKLELLKGQIADVEAKLKDTTLTEAQVTEYQKQLELLKGQKAELEAALKDGTLTKSDIEAYQKELDALHGNTIELIASLNAEGYDTATVQAISDQINAIQERQKEVTLIIADKTEIEPAKIGEYVTQLTELMKQQTEYELYIAGAGLEPEEIEERRDRLAEIQSRTETLTVLMERGKEGMTDKEWSDLVSEYNALTVEGKIIEIALQGAAANQDEVREAKKLLAEVQGAAEAIALNIGYSKNSQITQADLNNILSKMGTTGDISAVLDIMLSVGTSGTQELEELNRQLNEAYGNLVEMSGGYFTQEDVERGRITQDRYDNWLRNAQMQADTERMNFQRQVQDDRNNVEALVEKRELARQMEVQGVENSNRMQDDYQTLADMSAKANNLLAQYNLGQISQDAFFTAGQEIIAAGSQREWQDGTIGMNFDVMTPENLFGHQVGIPYINQHWEAGETANYLDNMMGWFKQMGAYENEDAMSYAVEANAANAALVQQYQNEVRVQELNSFAGFGFQDKNSSATIQELAANYATLDAAGQQMFENAIAGIAELNTTATYISDQEKINVQDLITQATMTVTNAAATEALGDIEAKMRELSTTYQGLETDLAKTNFNADNLKAVNAALESLGMDKISDLSELSAKLEEIASIDPSKLNFNAAADSLTKLTGSAAEAEAITAKATQQLNALAGTYNVYIKYTTIGGVPNPPAENALGGIYDGAFLSWVAEDGPEAIIPLGADKRGRGLDLWMQAGEMLGINEFADGGIMAPYAGILDDIPDDVWDHLWDDDSDGSIRKLLPSPGGWHTGGNPVHISVNNSPVFQIESNGGADEIMDKIKGHSKELAEMIGGEIADQLEDIVSNMV